MKNTVFMRELVIGEGMPKICVPITGRSLEEVYGQARAAAQAGPDLVEWRADFLDERAFVDHRENWKENLKEIAGKLREILGGIPLLFTFRTKAEGGDKTLDREDYLYLLREAAFLPEIDGVDVELVLAGEEGEELIDWIRENRALSFCSHHQYISMPSQEELAAIFEKMCQLRADVFKVAVLPRTPGEVLTLLISANDARVKYGQPLIAIAMGGLGLISRVSGEVFGSVVTFATVGEASAPGQLPIEILRPILETFHDAFQY